LLDELTFTPSDHEQDFERVVIVDDTFTTGKTAAAVVTLLRHHHLQQSCEVILACPLWLDTVRTEKT
jgi:adenine/guanine phosphoribosyltransferase-like PRPP-binding protein